MKEEKVVTIISLGCSKNLVDSEKLMRQFELNGYKIVKDNIPPKGSVVIVNTCGFIGDAKEESVNTILELVNLKQKGLINKLFVMGCLSQRYFDDLNESIPEVDKFYGKFDWNNIITDIGDSFHKKNNEERVISTPEHYAYLKIAEGCNRTCSYCAIPIIVGKYKSQPIENILEEAKFLVSKGVKELQLIAQDLSFYGRDIYNKSMLSDLVNRLADIKGVEWIRLHYTYPFDFPYDILPVIKERENVCSYLDMALQHINNDVLKKMHRHITTQETYDIIERIRSEVPGINLRTTLMVGHPGETEKAFNELIEFVKKVRFERMGAFKYSEEDGTYSAIHYKDEISQQKKELRYNELMSLQQEISADINSGKTGKIYKTIIDREDSNYYIGRTEFDSPEVDQEVYIEKTEELIIGNFYNIKIESSTPYDLYGKKA